MPLYSSPLWSNLAQRTLKYIYIRVNIKPVTSKAPTTSSWLLLLSATVTEAWLPERAHKLQDCWRFVLSSIAAGPTGVVRGVLHAKPVKTQKVVVLRPAARLRLVRCWGLVERASGCRIVCGAILRIGPQERPTKSLTMSSFSTRTST